MQVIFSVPLFSPPGAGNGKRTPNLYYAEHGFVTLSINIHHGLNSELPDSTYKALQQATNELATQWMQGVIGKLKKNHSGFYFAPFAGSYIQNGVQKETKEQK